MQRAAAIKSLILCLSIGFCSAFSTGARAQGTEERFQDLFITAGYCAAFGAALGTAFLAFKDDPSANLQYIAMGASLGFIGGSVLGTYIIFSPVVTDDSVPNNGAGSLALNQALPDEGVVFRPTYNRSTQTISSIEGGMTLARF